MILVQLLNSGTPDHVGLIASFLDLTDATSASEQFDARYQHGGGWRPMPKWTFDAEDASIQYPGDPKYLPRAHIQFRNESIFIYDAGWTCIVQQDGSFEVARMD